MERTGADETITVAAAFNGPRQSGNGGYACGLVAQALGGPAEVSLRSPVPLDAAAYRGFDDGVFSHCFVCGRARADSLGVFAGEVPDRELVASPWTPPAWTADGHGNVRPELVWAVLDCPTYFASYRGAELGLAFMVRDEVEIDAPVPCEQEHVLIGWPLRVEGRKRWAGSALVSAAGEVLARCEVMLVEAR